MSSAAATTTLVPRELRMRAKPYYDYDALSFIREALDFHTRRRQPEHSQQGPRRAPPPVEIKAMWLVVGGTL